MAENSPQGMRIGTVFARDIDSGTFGEVMYRLAGPAMFEEL